MEAMSFEARNASPTLLDVARAAGVSRTTVSNAFNRPDQLSAELRQRVLATAWDLGYPGPNPMARMLWTGRAGAIGVVFSDRLTYAVTDPAAIALLEGIALVCDQEEAALLILSALDEEAARRVVRQAAVDGFIIYCLTTETGVINAVRERGEPVVAVDEPVFADAPAVGIADRAGARQAAQRLLELGHGHIAILAMETRPDRYAGPLDAARRAGSVYAVTDERLAGYEDALRAAGLDLAAARVEERPCNNPRAAREATLGLLAERPRPTAILAMGDVFALAAIDAAKELGLRVPDDLSVVGFDDIPIASQLSPPLTTVRQPLVDKGRIAAELLFGRRQADKPIILPTELVVRSTTAPPPATPT
jgi:DNA-binding LacI/PurR family transcriptional regulator